MLINGKLAVLQRLVAMRTFGNWSIKIRASQPRSSPTLSSTWTTLCIWGSPVSSYSYMNGSARSGPPVPLTWASSADGIRFLGLEIYKVKTGYRMCQLGYIRELLRHHGLAEGPGARTPCPREWLIGEGEFEQVAHDEKSLRKAQQMTGELLC